jgi:hypothetical protein
MLQQARVLGVLKRTLHPSTVSVHKGRKSAFSVSRQLCPCTSRRITVLFLPVVLFLLCCRTDLVRRFSWAAAQTWEAAEDIHRACEEAGVQFMDGTMWVHSRRAAEMAGVIKADLGQLKSVGSAFAFPGAVVSPPAPRFHIIMMLVEPSGAAVRCA